jgi:hypothetical protein
MDNYANNVNVTVYDNNTNTPLYSNTLSANNTNLNAWGGNYSPSTNNIRIEFN